MPPPTVHPTAFVAPECSLAEDVRIGPFCVLTGQVRLEAGVELIGNVYIQGPATIGEGTTIYPFACIGFEGQDVKFKRGQLTAGVRVGARCILREHVTINAATKPDAPTSLGDRGFMLVGSHIGHDAVVGNDCTMVNGSMIGGHAIVGDNVLLGGQAAIHQFTRVGRYAHIAGDSAVSQHLPPFCIASAPNRIGGINRVGLRRAGFPREHITAIVQAYQDVLRSPKANDVSISMLRDRASALACPPLKEMADFIESAKGTGRGITPGMGKPPRDAVAWFKAGAPVATAEPDDHAE
ncbi:MAG: acyl-ACP--UDP-N-acetylglucosamine O-acyltransferase [Phycisphaerae bacterium]|nr:acyl-ACP--UDP-N-acetylglucosamine O-acyltransferase [Phycisphaerae bacterium]